MSVCVIVCVLYLSVFSQIGSRSSVYSPESRLRRSGSYIYENFMPTDGTDVKVSPPPPVTSGHWSDHCCSLVQSPVTSGYWSSHRSPLFTGPVTGHLWSLVQSLATSVHWSSHWSPLVTGAITGHLWPRFISLHVLKCTTTRQPQSLVTRSVSGHISNQSHHRGSDYKGEPCGTPADSSGSWPLIDPSASEVTLGHGEFAAGGGSLRITGGSLGS